MATNAEKMVQSLLADEKAKTLLQNLISETIRPKVRRTSIFNYISSGFFLTVAGFSILVFTYSLFLGYVTIWGYFPGELLNLYHL